MSFSPFSKLSKKFQTVDKKLERICIETGKVDKLAQLLQKNPNLDVNATPYVRVMNWSHNFVLIKIFNIAKW